MRSLLACLNREVVNHISRHGYSGAIDGRPEPEYGASNPALNKRNTVSVSLRTARSR